MTIKGTWTSDRRLYLNAEGAVVEARDPSRVSLLVAQGATIPMALAVKHGLVSSDGATVAPADAPTVTLSAPAPAVVSDLKVEVGGADEPMPSTVGTTGGEPVVSTDATEPAEDDLASILGVPQKAIDSLAAGGPNGTYETIEKIKAASDEDLLALDFIGEKTLATIREATKG